MRRGEPADQGGVGGDPNHPENGPSALGSAELGRLDGGRSGVPARRRRLADQRPLPSGRAVVGGLLVAVAMVATFALATRQDGRPTESAVVARHQLAPGTRLRADDLAVVRVDLPSPVGGQSFTDIASAVGLVTLGPLDDGDLVQRADVADPRGAPGQAVLSFPIARERALDGALEAGQVVDLLATYGTGTSAETVVVARQVRLLQVDTADHSTLTSAGQLVVTVALTDPAAALAAAHASQVAALTLVSTSSSTDSSGMNSYEFRPDADQPATSSSGASGPPDGPDPASAPGS